MTATTSDVHNNYDVLALDVFDSSEDVIKYFDELEGDEFDNWEVIIHHMEYELFCKLINL